MGEVVLKEKEPFTRTCPGYLVTSNDLSPPYRGPACQEVKTPLRPEIFGEGYPLAPYLMSRTLYHKNGEISSTCDVLAGKDIVFLIFSAYRCKTAPLFRKINSIYKESQLKYPNLEVIYTPLDESWKLTMKALRKKHGSWWAFNPLDMIVKILKHAFDVICLPTLVVIRVNGEFVTKTPLADIDKFGIDVVKMWR